MISESTFDIKKEFFEQKKIYLHVKCQGFAGNGFFNEQQNI